SLYRGGLTMYDWAPDSIACQAAPSPPQRHDEDDRRARESTAEGPQEFDAVPIAQLAPDHDRIKVIGERELQTLLSSGGGPDDPAFASQGGDAQNLVVFVAVNHEDGNGGCAVRPRDLRGSRLGHGGSVGA